MVNETRRHFTPLLLYDTDIAAKSQFTRVWPMKAYMFPGQGSQHVGMGQPLFDAFAQLTASADAILGYSIRDLCLEDAGKKLTQTQYTQPALYVVNALAWRKRREETGEQPDFVAGHSLGEYNALECAGALSFEDGLHLVQKRGALMSLAKNGGMAAIIGLDAAKVGEVLARNGFDDVDIANYNTPSQTVISGLRDGVAKTQAAFEAAGAMFIPLNVSGAFHSRYMKPARNEFEGYLADFSLTAPKIPVIANVTALPYDSGAIARTLAEQLTSSVRWADSIAYLLQQGVTDFVEVGPRDVLTNMLNGIRKAFKPRAVETPAAKPASLTPEQKVAAWNRAHRIGAKVRAKGYDEPLSTKSEAVVLFGHRAAIYMQGYNGYFALDEIEPA